MQGRKHYSIWRHVYILLFFILALFPVLNGLTLKMDTEPLVGVENTYPLPAFSWTDYNNAMFQDKFEHNFKHGFVGVRTATRLYNELRYRLFRQSDDSTVICKDDSVTYENYIMECLGLDQGHYCADEYIEELTSQIKRLSNLALAQGKQLLVVITPNKADFIKDEIPDKYFHMERFYTEEERGVHKLTKAMEQNGITFIDGSAILLSAEYPFSIFPKPGVHYTREAALQLVSVMADTLELKGIHIKKLVSEGRQYTDAPRSGSMTTDDDIWRLMNIFSRPKTRYSYPIENVVIPENVTIPKVFAQGGSFFYHLHELLRDNAIVDDINFLFYNISLYDMAENANHITDFNDPLIAQRVNESDIIILEVNVENVYGMGSGFYPTLERILSGDVAEVHEDPDVTYEGVGKKEEANGVSWRWSYGKTAKVVFHNIQLDDRLVIQYWVPYSAYSAAYADLHGSVNTDVYVNGEHYQTDSCSEDYIFSVSVSGSLRQADGTIEVEIKSPYSFYGTTEEGTKELSFQILSAGRKK